MNYKKQMFFQEGKEILQKSLKGSRFGVFSLLLRNRNFVTDITFKNNAKTQTKNFVRVGPKCSQKHTKGRRTKAVAQVERKRFYLLYTAPTPQQANTPTTRQTCLSHSRAQPCSQLYNNFFQHVTICKNLSQTTITLSRCLVAHTHTISLYTHLKISVYPIRQVAVSVVGRKQVRRQSLLNYNDLKLLKRSVLSYISTKLQFRHGSTPRFYVC